MGQAPPTTMGKGRAEVMALLAGHGVGKVGQGQGVGKGKGRQMSKVEGRQGLRTGSNLPCTENQS